MQMSKLERLIALAKLKRSGRSMTVREMSETCGVSQRTLYRYLNALTTLDSLAKLASKSTKKRARSDSDGLTGDEASLIRYALDHNPLAAYPHFARRFRSLGRKLNRARGGSSGGQIYQFKPARVSPVAATIDSLVDRYGKACVEGAPVEIHLRGRKSKVRTMWPRGIKVTGNRVHFLASSTRKGRSEELKPDSIRRIERCRGKAPVGSRRRGRKKG